MSYKGYVASVEELKRRSAAQMGKHNPSQETRDKIAAKRSIPCETPAGSFKSHKECAKAHGVSEGCVHKRMANPRFPGWIRLEKNNTENKQ